MSNPCYYSNPSYYSGLESKQFFILHKTETFEYITWCTLLTDKTLRRTTTSFQVKCTLDLTKKTKKTLTSTKRSTNLAEKSETKSAH